MSSYSLETMIGSLSVAMGPPLVPPANAVAKAATITADPRPYAEHHPPFAGHALTGRFEVFRQLRRRFQSRGRKSFGKSLIDVEEHISSRIGSFLPATGAPARWPAATPSRGGLLARRKGPQQHPLRGFRTAV
jgi:hypothetical protein